jgi:putative ABC transport system substrate-binding protein
MKRRDFIKVVAGSAAAWPLVAHAQQGERTRRVTVLVGLDEQDSEAQIEYRFAGGNLESINKYVAEVIGLTPDVIVANSTPVIAALQASKTTTPIVFAMVNDPVGQGFLPSLAHPGGNISGFTFLDFAIIGKWVDLLNDVKPDLSRVTLMFNPDTSPYFDAYLRSFKALPKQTSVEVQAAHIRSAAEADLVLAELGCGLIAGSDIFVVGLRKSIMKSAEQHRVPVISAYRQFVVEGSLMSYGPDTALC